MEKLVALIRTIPTQYFGEVEKAVVQNFQGFAFKEGSLQGRLRAIGRITDNRARLIARDQTAKMRGKIDELRQQDAGIDSYIWRTAQDERVVGAPGNDAVPTSCMGITMFGRGGSINGTTRLLMERRVRL